MRKKRSKTKERERETSVVWRSSQNILFIFFTYEDSTEYYKMLLNVAADECFSLLAANLASNQTGVPFHKIKAGWCQSESGRQSADSFIPSEGSTTASSRLTHLLIQTGIDQRRCTGYVYVSKIFCCSFVSLDQIRRQFWKLQWTFLKIRWLQCWCGIKG